MTNILSKFTSGNKKLIVTLVSCIVVICLDVAFLLRLQDSSIRGVKLKVAGLKQNLETWGKESKQAQELKNKQAQSEKRTPAGAKKIISEGEVASLLQDISTLANKNEVKITQMKPLKETAGLLRQEKDASISTKAFPLLVVLEGYADYHKLGRFVNDLENADTFIAVQDLKIVFQQASYFKQKISLALRTYVRK